CNERRGYVVRERVQIEVLRFDKGRPDGHFVGESVVDMEPIGWTPRGVECCTSEGVTAEAFSSHCDGCAVGGEHRVIGALRAGHFGYVGVIAHEPCEFEARGTADPA